MHVFYIKQNIYILTFVFSDLLSHSNFGKILSHDKLYFRYHYRNPLLEKKKSNTEEPEDFGATKCSYVFGKLLRYHKATIFENLNTYTKKLINVPIADTICSILTVNIDKVNAEPDPVIVMNPYNRKPSNQI